MNAGANAVLMAMLGGRGGRGPINGFLNSPNYDEERQKDALMNYGASLMSSQNPNNTTSGAVRQLGERLLGAVLTGYREKGYRDKEKNLAEQWGAILSRDAAPAGATMPTPKPMEGSTGDTTQDAASFEALAGGTAKGINPDDWAKTFGGATVAPKWGATPSGTYAQQLRARARELYGDKLDPQVDQHISQLEQYDAFTEPERRRQETKDRREDRMLDLEERKMNQDMALREREMNAYQELSGLLGGDPGETHPYGSGNIPQLSSNLTPIVNKATAEFNLSPELVNAVIMTESGGNQGSVSPKGATGVMQLMPGTAKDLGVNPNDLEGNIRGGAQYLRQMLDRYDGNLEHALMAYNWGPGNVNAWLKTGKGINGQDVPEETRRYVTSVSKNMRGPGAKSDRDRIGNDSIMSIPRERLLKIAMMPGQAGNSARYILEMQDKAKKDNKPVSLNDTSSLAKRWTSESAGYLDTADALEQLISYAKENSGAGDLGMIFSYMKALDPQSVVREGEQVQVQRTGGIPDQVWNMYLQAKDGRRLSPEQRRNLISAAGSRYKDTLRVQNNRNNYFRDLSSQYGIDPSLVIQNLYPGLEDRLAEFLVSFPNAASAPVPGLSGSQSSQSSVNGVNGQGEVRAPIANARGKTMSEIFRR